MNFKAIFFASFLFTTGLLHAQTDFKPGFVIKEKGDTVFGKIDYRDNLRLHQVCRFRQTGSQFETTYSPDEILAYRFTDSKYFISKELEGENVFLEFLIKGKVNIYYLQKIGRDRYFIEKEGSRLTEIFYEKGIKYKGATPHFYRSTIHLGILKVYLLDAPELQPKIKRIKKPEHHGLIKLAEDYHNSICEEEKCIIYEKESPFIKVNVEIVQGLVDYRSNVELDDKYYLQSGALLHFWMPRTSEKMYFKTGVLYSLVELNNEYAPLIKIPAHLEYIYPKGLIRPKLSYGVNFHASHFTSVSFSGGVNIRQTEKLFVSVYSDWEFDHLALVLPKDLISSSLYAGVFIKF